MSITPESQPRSSCSECGASIYPEHLARNLAGHWAGKPYCNVCLEKKIAEEKLADTMAGDVPTEAAELIASSQVHTFHAHLDDEALAQLDEQINSWLAKNPHIHVRSSNSIVGVFEGRQAGPHLILSIFYGAGPAVAQ